MLIPENTKRALSKFAAEVVKNSKSNLRNSKRSSSGKLESSIDSEVKVSKNSFQLTFEMEDYGEFIDKGVSGKKKTYKTPFRYTDKRPPAKAFDKWTVRRGIAPRDENGKFLSRRSINFIIANSVFQNGIKPSLFFTKPFEQAFKDLPEEVIEAFALDTEKFLEQSLKD